MLPRSCYRPRVPPSAAADDAVAKVFPEKAERDRLKSARHRGYLGEDIDAVLLLLDHLLQTTRLLPQFDAIV